MKKLILLLLFTIIFVSCDTHSDPTIMTSEENFEVLNNAQSINMTSALSIGYNDISKKGKKAYGYIKGDYYYFITEDNHYYKAVLMSNTNYTYITVGGLAFFSLVIFIIGIFGGYSVFKS